MYGRLRLVSIVYTTTIEGEVTATPYSWCSVSCIQYAQYAYSIAVTELRGPKAEDYYYSPAYKCNVCSLRLADSP